MLMLKFVLIIFSTYFLKLNRGRLDVKQKTCSSASVYQSQDNACLSNNELSLEVVLYHFIAENLPHAHSRGFRLISRLPHHL